MTVKKLPDYLIIGVQKGGTTSFYDHLVRHPQVARAKMKEIYYFNKHFQKGVAWYRSQFPSLEGEQNHLVTGEATPNYIDDPIVPARVFKTMPNVKLIVLLRHPADRAYSQFQMGVRMGKYRKGEFAGLIQKEMKGQDTEARFLDRSLYAKHLQRWLRLFPNEQMLILKSEDFFAYPSQVYRKVLAFLNLPYWEPEQYQNFTWKLLKRKGYQPYRDMNADMRNRLIHYFQPHNEKLYTLLGRDLQWE